jgi:hypothetical protein
MYSILLYMIGDLLLGICIGLIIKQVNISRAAQSSNSRVFATKDYSSIYFGKNFPRSPFDPFQLPRELVIVRYVNDEVVSEKFFTFLGDSAKAIYQNGQYEGLVNSGLRSPVFFFTVLFPILQGFVASFVPSLQIVGIPLLISGLAWIFLTSLPIIGSTFRDRS